MNCTKVSQCYWFYALLHLLYRADRRACSEVCKVATVPSQYVCNTFFTFCYPHWQHAANRKI
jgi:hypothetical protein